MVAEGKRAMKRLEQTLGGPLGQAKVSRGLRRARRKVIEFGEAVTPELAARVRQAREQAGEVGGKGISTIVDFGQTRMPIDLTDAASQARMSLGRVADAARGGLGTTQMTIGRGVGTAQATAPKLQELLEQAWSSGMHAMKGGAAEVSRGGVAVAEMPGRAGHAIGAGAERAEKEAKDFGKLMFWLAVAGGLAFFVLVPSADRRERFLAAARKFLYHVACPAGRAQR